MRLVLDTNTVISGLLWGGMPGRLIDGAIAGAIELASSISLLAELHGVLSREKFTTRLAALGLGADDVFDGYAALVRIVTPVAIPPTILRDLDDDAVLAAAMGARADLIVSGDADLELEIFRDIPIVISSDAVKRCRLD